VSADRELRASAQHADELECGMRTTLERLRAAVRGTG
jgi:hypothetical protein